MFQYRYRRVGMAEQFRSIRAFAARWHSGIGPRQDTIVAKACIHAVVATSYLAEIRVRRRRPRSNKGSFGL